MINAIADEMVDVLEGLNIFKKVDRTVTRQALQTPPAAVLFLAYDKEDTDSPETLRELGWDVALLVPALGADLGRSFAGDCIDAVRTAFIGWLAFDTGGMLPAKVPGIYFEGIERTLLIYTVRITMQVIPATIERNKETS